MQMATLGLRRGQDALARAAAAARHAGVQATTVLRRADDVRDALFEQAGSYDLLVLGTHGAKRRAGMLLGDVASTALHRAPVPTLVARPAPHGTVFPADVLVASDGTAASHDAVEVAAAIALRHGARVTLLHAGAETSELYHDLAEQQTRLAERTGAEPAIVEVDGHAPEAIVRTARELPASLIVTGSRMLTGVRALRSVSERVGHMAPCSVLVVRS